MPRRRLTVSRPWGVDALLADPRVDIVLNLTTPQYHVPVDLVALEAGKNVYSEKPLSISIAEAQRLIDVCARSGLRVGCAPDTFLGAAHQTARRIIDTGDIGEPVAATAIMMMPGHERWHPNPEFYYQSGGGPLMDMGLYYLTCLVNLFGPVAKVCCMAKTVRSQRSVASGPRAGQQFAVKVATHISALVVFESVAAVTLVTSFDVQKHTHTPIEIYGAKGSMIVADPNHFSGEVSVSGGPGEDWHPVAQRHQYGDGDYRIIGLADMAEAIVKGRDHRASLDLSLHVLEIMETILVTAETGRSATLDFQCRRPEPLNSELPAGQFYD